MKTIIGIGIGSLFFVMNANAVELVGDINSGFNSDGVDLVLQLNGIDYSYPETVVKGTRINTGNSEAGTGISYSADPDLVGWSEYPGGFRLTAGMLDNYPRSELATGSRDGIAIDVESTKSDIIIGSKNLDASVAESVPNSNEEQSDGRLKLAVGVGTTSLESDIDLDAELNADGFNGMDRAELAALLNEAETETSIDLEDYFARPALAIGVNYAF